VATKAAARRVSNRVQISKEMNLSQLHKNGLTPTGLLMEGQYIHPLSVCASEWFSTEKRACRQLWPTDDKPTYEDHPELMSTSVISFEKLDDDAETQGPMSRGIRGTRYLFPPFRRVTLHAPHTSQQVESFQHDSSGSDQSRFNAAA
jgi:hypothetical protein